MTLAAIQRWAAGIAESQGTATEEEERVAHAIRKVSTTFRVEQPGPRSELDLPACTANQAIALVDIKDAGGTYARFVGGDWLPPHGDCLSKPARQFLRQTDRTILSLIRTGYLTVTAELQGKPVQVTLTFP